MILHSASWPAPSHVKAMTTTLYGGVSKGKYQSLNLAQHVDDNPEHVSKNRSLLVKGADLPSDPIWLEQVHGTEIIELTHQTVFGLRCNDTVPVADGAFTTRSKIVCAVLTADCMPLLLTNRVGDRVAALHVGWRGLADGMVEAGVQKLDCPPQDIIAWAGPCIGPSAFEIGDEVRQQLGGDDHAYSVSDNSLPDKPKWFANLYDLVGQRLTAIGVEQYSHSSACTYRDQQFFSYRRSGQCGRMASLIWIE